MRKTVFLHKRRPGMGVDEFHAALAAACVDDPSIPGLASYVQSHTLVRGYQKSELLFDAVEEFSFLSQEAAEAFAESGLDETLAARRRPLLDPEASMAMTVDVHRVKDLPVPAGAVKNIEFVNQRPGLQLGEFRRYWREVHGPLAAKIPSILRYEQNHLEPRAYGGDTPPRYDGLAITWFESTAAMRAGAETEVYRATRADEANFLPDGHLPIIITREVLAR